MTENDEIYLACGKVNIRDSALMKFMNIRIHK
jgi:hypothetical protein